MVARRTLQGQVVEAYLGHLTARRMKRTVAAALEQLAAYEEQTSAYVDAQLISKDALFKVNVQKAEMEQARFQVDKATQRRSYRLRRSRRRRYDLR